MCVRSTSFIYTLFIIIIIPASVCTRVEGILKGASSSSTKTHFIAIYKTIRDGDREPVVEKKRSNYIMIRICVHILYIYIML